MLRRLLSPCLLVVCAAAAAQDPLPPALKGSEKLAALLDQVSQAQARITTLEASFEQRRSSRLLARPSDSKGRFYFQAPDWVRWEYSEPRQMTVLLSGGVALTYRPAEKRAERVEVGRVQRRVLRFLGAAEPLAALKQYFSFTLRDPGDARNYTLTLAPTTYQLKKRISSVEIEIDRARYLPVAVSYTEPDGDRTAYSFRDITVNQPLAGGLFNLELPSDVEVVRIKLRSGE
ncbi:MAG: outer membrane lipoprotein carrier protein LolA [Acidobacteriota bacterium]